MKRILITTANGMFGKAVAGELLKKQVILRLMVRDRSKCIIQDSRAEIVTADLDRPETLDPVVQGVDSIFLATPMDPRLADRETALIHAASRAGVSQVTKIYGAVKHEGDRLDSLHQKVIDALHHSGIPQIMVSPGSVMETSLYTMAESVKFMRAIYGISGHGKISLVALKDIAEVTACLMTTEGHEGKNYELTGPEAIDMYEVADRFTKMLGKKIRYIDLTEEKFTRMLMKYDKTMTPERMEIEVLCHLRAWGKGNASLVTDTVDKILGRKATPVDDFIASNRDLFSRGMFPAFAAAMMRWTI
jgi:uncharacterized protein YbjT (DUF2867 family)